MADDKRQVRVIYQSILIWIDKTMQSDDSQTKDTLEKFYEVFDHIEFVKTVPVCIELLNQWTSSNCYVITTETIEKSFVQQMHSISNLESIFVVSTNQSLEENSDGDSTKIKGFYPTIESVLDELRRITEQVRNDVMAISIISTDKEQSMNTGIARSYLFTSMLSNMFLDMKFERKHFDRMIRNLRDTYRNNDQALSIIDRFSNEYQPEKVIEWYTNQCFIYKLVNQAFRKIDIRTIIYMAPLIADLHNQILALYEQQINIADSTPLTLYRGFGMVREDFLKLKELVNGYLSFDGFLLANDTRDNSLKFAVNGSKRPGHVGILFFIRINPSINSVPYARIDQSNINQDSDQILFAMNSTFKITCVKELENYAHVFQVELEFVGKEDPEVQYLRENIADEYDDVPEYCIARMLFDVKNYDLGEEVCMDLVNKTDDARLKGKYIRKLASAKCEQCKYQRAIELYQQALDVYSNGLPENDTDIAKNYEAIGEVYYHMEDYSTSILFNEKAHEIWKKSLPINHSAIADSYLTIGCLFYYAKSYSQALEYFENAHRFFLMAPSPIHEFIEGTENWIERVKTHM